MIKLTYAELAAMNPCCLETRKALWGRRRYLTAAQALAAGATIPDLLWVAGKLGRKDLCVRFAVACAERVAGNNTDPRVQAAIDAAKAWLDNPSESAARSAASAASAAWSAESAARSAAWSAASAAWSAESAAESAAWSAARSAARSAASAARSAASAASAEQAAQREIFLKIFGG